MPAIAAPSSTHYLTDEAECVRRLATGDVEAFERIFRAYYNPLRGYAARIVGGQAIADELAQDVLVAIWEGRARLNVTGNLSGYLFRAARNRAMNALRHEHVVSRTAAVASRSDLTPGHGEGPMHPEALAERSELIAALGAAIDRLPKRMREAYLLRWANHLSRGEAARAMGISVKGFEVQLTRAVKALKAALADYL
jgi:RNA polymerase sigma-70 factor (ECF subfamily)